MMTNEFLDKTATPTPAALGLALGARHTYWLELRKHAPDGSTSEWKYYGKTIGWTMKVLHGKRNLCFMTASRGLFAVSFVFGDKGVAAVRKSALPRELVDRLVSARKYAEGRGIRVEVRSRRALEHAKKLMDIKAKGGILE